MTTQLVKAPSNTVLTLPNNHGFRMLDVYAANGVSDIRGAAVDAIATISAGTRQQGNGNRPGNPTASRDGTIYLHDPEGRAPGLLQALALNDYKSLTVAFPYDDLNLFIQQRFTEYSATALLTYGDELGVTVMENQQRRNYAAGTAQYLEAIKRCKVSVSIYFYLAEWTPQGPQVIFPDGFGLYRLRFTSRNSLRSIVTSIQTVMRHSGGKIAGLPFELSISYREVPDATGTRRKVAVWNALVQPPETIKLSSKTFREFATQSLAQGELLMLPAPAPETLEAALSDGPDTDLDTPLDAAPDTPDEAQISLMQQGGPCDAPYWCKRWFSLVRGSFLDSDAARAVFLSNYTNGHFTSLAAYLKTLTETDAGEFINVVDDELQKGLSPRELYTFLVQQCEHLNITNGGKPWPALSPKARPDIVEKALERVEDALAACASPMPGATSSSEPVTPEPEPAPVPDDVQEGEVVEESAPLTNEAAFNELIAYCAQRGFCLNAEQVPDEALILDALSAERFTQYLTGENLAQAKQALERFHLVVNPDSRKTYKREMVANLDDDDDSDPFADE